MSDQSPAKRTRAPINVLKVLNSLRAEKGLPKVGAKPKAVRLSKEQKEELLRKVLHELFPEALVAHQVQFSEKQISQALVEYEKRLRELQGEKAPYSGKPRGRKVGDGRK